MRIILFMLVSCQITACANLRSTDSLTIQTAKEQIEGVYTMDPHVNTNKDEFPLKRYGFLTNRESFEVLFTENDVLLIRSTNQKLGRIKYFNGAFKQNGVYEYLEKEAVGIPLINRSVSYLRLRVWKSSESERLKIELKSKSSAQIFIFMANRTTKTLIGTYMEVTTPNSK